MQSREFLIEASIYLLGSTFEGWLLAYDDDRSPPNEDHIGKLCVVGLSNNRVLPGQIDRGPKGEFIINSATRGSATVAKIAWATPVKRIVQC